MVGIQGAEKGGGKGPVKGLCCQDTSLDNPVITEELWSGFKGDGDKMRAVF